MQIGATNQKLLLLLLMAPLTLCASSGGNTARIGLNHGLCHDVYRRIAVLPFDTSGYRGDDSAATLGEAISDQFSAELLNIGYTVIERSRINSLLRENELLQAGALTSESQNTSFQKFSGVDALVLGNVIGRIDGWALTMRMVLVKDGTVAWTITSGKKSMRAENLIQLLDSALKKEKLNLKHCRL